MANNIRTLPRSPRPRGVALIIVLAALVLVTILVLAFLTGIGSELQSSKMYANGSSVKLLAQSAVALVIGEIQAATSNPTNCWASEPGMIRTYSSTGTATGYYKLYSDSNITGTTTFDHTQITNLIPDGTGGTTAWYNQPGVYIDLNQPVYLGTTLSGTNYYPILDGNSADYGTTYTDTLSTLTKPAATSAINSLTPVTNSLPAVTGFWLNSNTPRNPASPDFAPMPVKWLYVLQNGEVIIPDSNPVNNVVTFNNISSQPKPSSNDPIVGRIAYWTDDESCKVNINTASEGTFWDTPRCYSTADYNYAMYQPAQNEFQRYPGHPATVSLSAVFNGLTADSSYPENLYSTPPATPTGTTTGVAPRTTAGGSKEGTVSTATLTPTGTLTNGLTLVASRLYSTPDDFLFQPYLTGTPGTGTRNLNDLLVPELSQTAVQKAGFFITACSDAPDVNVFNLPRVSMWPITLTGASASAATPAETAFDKLIAYCGTINGNKYYFQRWDPTSSTNDLPATGTGGSSSAPPLARNRDLLEYLRTLTSAAIPGFGGSFGGSGGKYSSPGDRDQILTEMFDYIRCTNLQDTSSTTATPYAVDLSSATAVSQTNGYTLNGGLGQVVPIQDTTISIKDAVTNSNLGTVTTVFSNPRGFGRFPTLQQAALVFIGAGDNMTAASTATYTQEALNPNPPTSYLPPVTANHQRVQAGFFFQMTDPAEGVAVTRPYYEVVVSGLNNLYWNDGQASAYPIFSSGTETLTPTAVEINGQTLEPPTGTSSGFQGWSYGGTEDFRQFSILRDSINATPKWGPPVYPFISAPTGQSGTLPDMAWTPAAGGTFTFSNNGDVLLQIYSLNSAGTPSLNPVQTFYLNFPSGTFPVPASIDNNVSTSTLTPIYPAANYLPSSSTFTGANAQKTVTSYDFLSFLDSYGGPVNSSTMGSAWGRLGFPAWLPWFSKLDVVRAIIASDPSGGNSYATPGDTRLIAARQFVTDQFYQPIGTGFPSLASYTYTSFPGPFFSHMLRYNTSSTFYGSVGGALIGSPASYSDGQTQYFTGGSSTDLGDSLDYFAGSSGIRPKDNLVANQGANVTVANKTAASSCPGDWDNGIENSTDGAYINKPDEGDTGLVSSGTYTTNGYPYFELDYGSNLPGQTFFTPNRMIPSPGMFGSLPTGVWSDKAWQTLLFRPGPANPTPHPGLGTPVVGPPYTTPPDHLFLDLFNMPVVEPYAISTPLATSGRINMNYLIIPFTYINRDTGLRAAMKNQMITSIPSGQQSKYKIYQNVAGGPGSNGTALSGVRWPINLDATLSQFLARFYNTSGTQGAEGANGVPDIFHSASEICDIDLVPSDTTGATLADLAIPVTRAHMDTYWAANVLTGDNSRERPYANLYPLLTTKSNTFTVHYRVQTLKQALTSSAAPTAWTQWREGTDVVTSEYRGSETIERYIDPNVTTSDTGTTMPDYATTITSSNLSTGSYTPLSQFYKFRVVSTKQFPP